MADAKAPAPAFETVTVAPDSSVTVKVEAAHATFHGHAMHSCKEIVGRAGKTIDVPAAAAVELRALGYVV